ncbi:protein phosphatase PTC7 homolog [Babylonia areolata]|uniref:protein phosphatase PTC7 homolog n=1 Tax=Babylonia areolata TaxID=304850 RepID=UPI003FD5B093
MQSVALYGRLVARALVAGIHNEFQLKQKQPLHLVTGSSGFSKSVTKNAVFNKWNFGDDAYFIARSKTADVIGVADGVGGWRNYGIDPSVFPRQLMATCERMVQEGHFQPQAPASIIAASYQELMQYKDPLMGSSTACIVSLHREERTIYTANLGDSGFLVVREGEVVHRSVEQQHYFNTPYQLAVAPPGQQGRVLSDSPEMAESSSFKVEDGDVIILGTDGLFDNLSEDMILGRVSCELKDSQEDSVQRTASSIAESAYHLSFDPDYMSPFALSAINAGVQLSGGKPDDITCILARVTHQSDIYL